MRISDITLLARLKQTLAVGGFLCSVIFRVFAPAYWDK
jgi:hypothetical protein